MRYSPLRHSHDPEGESYRHTDGQALWDSSHGQRHSDVEHLQQLLTLREPTASHGLSGDALCTVFLDAGRAGSAREVRLFIHGRVAAQPMGFAALEGPRYVNTPEVYPQMQYHTRRGHHWRVRHAPRHIFKTTACPPVARQREQ